MGAYAMDAATALQQQLGTLYTAAGSPLTSQELWARVGVTPMIGLNDVTTETFYLSDAQELAAFAGDMKLGLLSMWSVNRDHACPDSTWVQLTCSSSPDQDADWKFMAALGGL